MRYWASSAILALLLSETPATRLSSLFDADPHITTWWGTTVECVSAIVRRTRTRESNRRTLRIARARLGELSNLWTEVQPRENVRQRAIELLERHPLRAADAMQLASAVAMEGQSDLPAFVSLDERLRAAAAAEGFTVLPVSVV